MQKLFVRSGLGSAFVLAFLLLAVVFWKNITSVSHFDLHGSCYDWLPPLLALHVSSDVLIGLAYLFISISLGFFVYRLRNDIPFRWIFLAFGAFIVACGCTHFMEVVTTVFVPVYWLAGIIKVITAIASVGTAIALPPLFPQVRRVIADAKRANDQGQEIARLYAQLKENYYALANAMPLLVWTGDANGTSQFYNDAWQSYTGLSIQKLLQDTKTLSYIHPDDVPQSILQWHTALEDFKAYETELRLLNTHDEYRWHLQRTTPVGNPVRGWISTTVDIDRQKHIEQELRKTREQQDMFLSMTSHELKTPLTSLQLHISLLYRRLKDDANYGKSMASMHVQMQRIIRLVNDLLAMSRAKTDQLMLNVSRFAVDTFVEGVVENVQRTSNHTLIVTCETNAEIEADKDRIEQVLVNFLTNAIKYSPATTPVNICTQVDKDTHEVFFSVQDEGIGITPEVKKHIFEQYYRSPNQKYAGLGIGLYIAAEIIKRHQGRIWVESQEGKGSTFYFSLPISDTPGVSAEVV